MVNGMANSSFPSWTRIVLGAALGTVLLAAPLLALAQNPGLPAFTSTPVPGGGQN
jgi:flagellar biosynthetic protein FliP